MDSESRSGPPEPDPGDELRTAISQLGRAELRLVLAESAAPVRRTAGAGMLLALGAVAALIGLGALGWAAGALLATQMPAWGAALIVAGILSVVAAASFGMLVRRHRDDPLIRLLGPESSAAAQDMRAEAVIERERAEQRVQAAGLAMGEALVGAAAERGVQAAVAVVGKGAAEVVELTEDVVGELADDVVEGVEDVVGDGDAGDDPDGGTTPRLAVRVVTAPLRLVVSALEEGLDRTRRSREE